MRNRITFSAYAAAWTAGAAASTETAAAFFFALRFLTHLVEPAFEGTLLDVEAEAALALRLLALLDARDTLLLALDALDALDPSLDARLPAADAALPALPEPLNELSRLSDRDRGEPEPPDERGCDGGAGARPATPPWPPPPPRRALPPPAGRSEALARRGDSPRARANDPDAPASPALPAARTFAGAACPTPRRESSIARSCASRRAPVTLAPAVR